METGKTMTTKEVARQLRDIAEQFRLRRNDPVAMMAFQVLVARMTDIQRRDLAVVLRQMIGSAS